MDPSTHDEPKPPRPVRSATSSGRPKKPRPPAPRPRRPPAASAAARTRTSPRPSRSAGPTKARPTPARRAGKPSAPKASNRNAVITLSTLTVGVVGVAAVTFLTGNKQAAGPAQPGAPAAPGASTTTASSTPPTLPPNALTTFRDATTGFTTQYPKAWQRLESPDPDVRLVVAGGEADAFSVRVQNYEQPTTAENMDNLKAFADAVVGTNKTAKILLQKEISVDNMLGFYYLYTYADPSGEEGAHAHYFLFRGRRSYQLVFQTVPSSGFQRLGGIFDQIAASFRTDPA